jgi:hypothetical protein
VYILGVKIREKSSKTWTSYQPCQGVYPVIQHTPEVTLPCSGEGKGLGDSQVSTLEILPREVALLKPRQQLQGKGDGLSLTLRAEVLALSLG